MPRQHAFPRVRIRVFNPEYKEKQTTVEAYVNPMSIYSSVPVRIIKELEVKPFTSIKIRRLNGSIEKLELYQIGVEIEDMMLYSSPAIISDEQFQIGRIALFQLGAVANEFEKRFRPIEILAPEDSVFYEFINTWIPNVYKSITTLDQVRETYLEIIELYNDLIDYITKYNRSRIESPLTMSIITIAFPQAATMIASYLSGAIPHCNLSIRLILEAVATAYFADKSINHHELNMDPLLRWKRILKKVDRKGFRAFCKSKLSEIISEELVNSIVDLWNKTSGSWLHVTGLLRRMIKAEDVTSLIMGPFLAYDESDISDINVLKENLSHLRSIMKKLIAGGVC